MVSSGDFPHAGPAEEGYARRVDVSVEREADGRLLVKLGTDAWEVNVRASADDFLGLAEVRSAGWQERHTLRAGESAGAPVFWATEGDQATLLIGLDDETWDVAFTLPLTVVDEIVREASRRGHS